MGKRNKTGIQDQKESAMKDEAVKRVLESKYYNNPDIGKIFGKVISEDMSKMELLGTLVYFSSMINGDTHKFLRDVLEEDFRSAFRKR
jgi:hypothetical protein